MSQKANTFQFEEEFLTQTIISVPLGDFRLWDKTRVQFFFTPAGLAMRILPPSGDEGLRLTRELIDDGRIKSIFIGSDEVRYK